MVVVVYDDEELPQSCCCWLRGKQNESSAIGRQTVKCSRCLPGIKYTVLMVDGVAAAAEALIYYLVDASRQTGGRLAGWLEDAEGRKEGRLPAIHNIRARVYESEIM